MRILVLCPRFPELGGKGDQLRAFQQVRHLAARHELTVATTGAPRTPEVAAELGAMARVERVAISPARRVASTAEAMARRMPAQVAWMTPRAAERRFRELSAGSDVVLASTVRAVRGPLRSPLVLDHVDCLSLNMRLRATGPEPLPLRLAARREAARLSAWEHRAAAWAVAQVATAAADAAALPARPPVHVVPQGWDGEPFTEPPGHVRDIDVVFTGNMRYPPNRDAALWLAREIAPRIRARRPGARIVVVGRDAGRLALEGVEVAADVPDLHDFLRRARVAIVPLRDGTGAPNKVIEAAANRAALVAMPWTLERFSMTAPTARTPEEFALQAARLLGDEVARRAAVDSALEAVSRHTVAALVGRLERLLSDVAG